MLKKIFVKALVSYKHFLLLVSRRPKSILVLGLAKSGTTIVSKTITHSVSGELIAEPKNFIQPNDPDKTTVAKVHINHYVGNKKELQKFLSYEKKVLLVRDPRDRLVSGVFFLTRKSEQLMQDFFLRVRKKEKHPSSESLFFNSRGGKVFEPFMERLTDLLEIHQKSPDFFVLRYEDFIDGNIRDLERYLGFRLVNVPDIQNDTNYVKRSATHGDWKNFLTVEDVAFLKPQFKSFLEMYGYNTDWRLSDDQHIDPAIASEYIKKKFNSITFSEQERQITLSMKVFTVINLETLNDTYRKKGDEFLRALVTSFKLTNAHQCKLVVVCTNYADPNKRAQNLLDWLDRNGINVVMYDVSSELKGVIDIIHKDPFWYGAYARYELDLIESDQENMLYVDFDCLFVQPLVLDYIKTIKTIGITEDRDNNGVLIFNRDFLKKTRSDFIVSIIEERKKIDSNRSDQHYCLKFWRDSFEYIPNEYNWRPTKGFNIHAKIIHLHEPKPDVIESILNNKNLTSKQETMLPYFKKNPDTCTYYFSLYKNLLQGGPESTLPPIVICGNEKSGTTLISEVLCKSGLFDNGFECGFLLAEKPLDFSVVTPYKGMLKKAWKLTDNQMSLLYRAYSFGHMYELLKEFSPVVDRNKQLIDKTPSYIKSLSNIISKNPKAKYIVMARDPRATIYSWSKRAPHVTGKNLSQAVTRYMDSYYGYQEAIQNGFGDSIMVLQHEELCLNPKGVVSRLCSFLDIDFDPDMISFQENRFQENVYGREISDTYIFEYKDTLSDTKQEEILLNTKNAQEWWYEK